MADDDERDDPDRAAILRRRNRFIELALSTVAAGSLAACDDPVPRPCLEPMALPDDAQPQPCLKIAAPDPDAGAAPPPAADAGKPEPKPQPCLKPLAQPPQPQPQPCLAPPPDRAKPQPCLSMPPPRSLGFVILATTPAVSVTIDGEARGRTPLKTRLPEGKHTVKLEDAAAGISETRVIEVKGGETNRVEWKLK